MDMLVKLYNLPLDWSFIQEQQARGITIRKPIGPERHYLVSWVKTHFQGLWSSEADMAMSNWPVSCFIATRKKEGYADPFCGYVGELIGFACYDATALGYFGPIGVLDEHQGHGTGKALLLACLLDMRLKGYGYAVIGGAGPTDFYQKAASAVEIPASQPGIWEGLLIDLDSFRD